MTNAGTTQARPLGQAVTRGLMLRCPNCGRGPLFASYLKVADTCPRCGETYSHQRADDAPPYVVIFIVGHLIVAGVLAVERAWQPDLWVHAALWLPLTLAFSLALLPPAKGALVAVQWAQRMHGFGAPSDSQPSAPPP